MAAAPTTPRIMGQVLIALIPAAGVLLWLFGIGVALNLAAATATAAAAEAAAVRLRGRSIRAALGDGSTLVAAAIIALALPPLLPWWIPATAAGIAALLGKHAYGGLGQNAFNPAMVGYVAVLLAFPQAMGLWPAPGLGGAVAAPEAVAYFLGGAQPPMADALTYATPLDR
ncbi:RnfABCDGE type electron transport complex subunit D, partial [Halorhodospira neutriphila]